MANLAELETITTQRCGQLAGMDVVIYITDETSFIKIGDNPSISVHQWFEQNARVCDAVFKLFRRARHR